VIIVDPLDVGSDRLLWDFDPFELIVTDGEYGRSQLHSMTRPSVTATRVPGSRDALLGRLGFRHGI
jgi:hypothetical protein